jgi:hypothetical protein
MAVLDREWKLAEQSTRLETHSDESCNFIHRSIAITLRNNFLFFALCTDKNSTNITAKMGWRGGGVVGIT